MKKILLIMTSIFVFCLCLTGCMSKEEEALLHQKESEALQYFKEKYNLSDIQLDESSYFCTGGGISPPRNTKDMSFDMSDGSTVIYWKAKDCFADNKQAAEISEALSTQVYFPALEQLKADIPAEKIVSDDVFFNLYTLDVYQEEFFTSYYTGNINDFMEQEELSITCEDILALCQPDSSYRSAMKDFCETLQKTFSIDDAINITALSPERANSYFYEDETFPDFYEDGCYLKYTISNETIDTYEARYIPLFPGIYVTSIEPNFMLKDNDVTLGKTYTEKELQTLIDTNYDTLPDESPENKNGAYLEHDKAHVDKGVISADTSVYQLNFSKRLKNFTDSNGKISCYFRFVPEEIPDINDSLYYFPPGNDNWDCSCICDQNNPLGFHSLNEQNYYFVGTQEFIKN